MYNYTDHLGNVRMSYTDNRAAVPKILEENHYYPFGLKHENYASERFEFIKEPHGTLYVIQPTERREWQYKYNGKEWQDELGLNFYDYGARNYDAAIGRWMNVDPLAEQGRRWSPYVYALNNPVYFIDPDGMWPWPPFLNTIKSSAKKLATNLQKSYESLKTNMQQTKNKIVKSTEKKYEEAKQYAKENKKGLLDTAEKLQNTGDTMMIAGVGAALVGSLFAGVGAGPGAKIAGEGAVISTVGAVIEIGTEFLTDDNDTLKDTAIFIGGEVINKAVDKAIPGPTPDLIDSTKEIVKNGNDILKTGTQAKTAVVGNALKEKNKDDKINE